MATKEAGREDWKQNPRGYADGTAFPFLCSSCRKWRLTNQNGGEAGAGNPERSVPLPSRIPVRTWPRGFASAPGRAGGWIPIAFQTKLVPRARTFIVSQVFPATCSCKYAEHQNGLILRSPSLYAPYKRTARSHASLFANKNEAAFVLAHIFQINSILRYATWPRRFPCAPFAQQRGKEEELHFGDDALLGSKNRWRCRMQEGMAYKRPQVGATKPATRPPRCQPLLSGSDQRSSSFSG